MMKRSLALVLCGLLVGAGSAWPFQGAARRSRFVDEVGGYSLETPRFPGADAAANLVPAVFNGPLSDGFASSVNVNVQRVKTTRNDYREQSLGQFKQLGLARNADRDLTVSGRDAVEFDSQGKLGGRELRILALAVIDADRVVLVTCTAPAEAFPAVEAEFRACLASFRLAGPNA